MFIIFTPYFLPPIILEYVHIFHIIIATATIIRIHRFRSRHNCNHHYQKISFFHITFAIASSIKGSHILVAIIHLSEHLYHISCCNKISFILCYVLVAITVIRDFSLYVWHARCNRPHLYSHFVVLL